MHVLCTGPVRYAMTQPTEFSFTLPGGYTDSLGSVHREGIMRLATAADEILSMKDPRVQADPAYLTLLILSRVVTRIGRVDNVTPEIIGGLSASDRAYLEEFYRKINEAGPVENL